MMIRAGHPNADITTAAQCSLNTVKAVRHDMEDCNEDYESVAMASGKEHRRCSDCIQTTKFVKQLQDKVIEDPGKRIRALAREMGVGIATMKMALNEDLRYFSYKRRKGQLITSNQGETSFECQEAFE